MKNRLIPSALCLAALGGTTSVSSAAPPNIIYILVDDMGFADCGFNGGKDIRTPNIDALARKGLILQNYYVQPLCSATRCTLLTGRTPNHHGIYGAIMTESRYGLPLDEHILPQLLKTAGYTTAIVGKWHCGEYKPEYRPTRRGWDHQYGHWLGRIDYYTHENKGTNDANYSPAYRGDTSKFRPDWYRNDNPIREKGYSTHLIANEAIRLIHQRAAAPLFLYVAFNAVHSPYQSPDSYQKPYSSLTPKRREFAAMLSVVDEAIGKIYAALHATGQAADTLIIFSSDNGGVSPGIRADNTPLRDGKGSIYEGGVRSAAFVLWPGKIKPNTKTPVPVHIADWYPTLAAIAGIDPTAPIPSPLASSNPKSKIENPKSLDGQNILPLLLENKPPARDALLIVGTSPKRYALRMGDWKLLVNTKGKAPPAPATRRDADPDEETDNEPIATTQIELYNLATDISEKHNRAPTEPARAKMMLARAQSMMADATPDLATTTAAKPKTTK